MKRERKLDSLAFVVERELFFRLAELRGVRRVFLMESGVMKLNLYLAMLLGVFFTVLTSLVLVFTSYCCSDRLAESLMRISFLVPIFLKEAGGVAAPLPDFFLTSFRDPILRKAADLRNGVNRFILPLTVGKFSLSVFGVSASPASNCLLSSFVTNMLCRAGLAGAVRVRIGALNFGLMSTLDSRLCLMLASKRAFSVWLMSGGSARRAYTGSDWEGGPAKDWARASEVRTGLTGGTLGSGRLANFGLMCILGGLAGAEAWNFGFTNTFSLLTWLDFGIGNLGLIWTFEEDEAGGADGGLSLTCWWLVLLGCPLRLGCW